MFSLFQSIFGSGRDESAPHSAELIRSAIERAVDGTDTRLRALPGYQKQLRPAVIRAIDHVVALVDGLPPALDLSPQSFGTEPEVTAYFASVEHLREVLGRDATLQQWFRSADGEAAGRCIALLLMTLEERQVFGVALEGDTLRRDVAQTTISFSRHQLVDPTAGQDETRRLLKRRAFDHLLALALGRIATALAEHGELKRERDLLRRKCSALAAGHWGFDRTGDERPPALQALRQQLEDIESQLSALRAGTGLLQAHLDIVVDVLMCAEHNFWLARRALVVDRMGVKRAQASAAAPEISLSVLHNAVDQSFVARLVGIGRAALPAQTDLLREAERYLG